MELYMTRHGESEGNVRAANNVSAAALSEEERENPRLTPLGRRQAFLLGERMAPCDLDVVIASPLLRAVETAYEIVRQQTGKSAFRMELMPELMEVGAPEGYRGTPEKRLRELFPDAAFSFVFTESPVYPSSLEVDHAQRLLRARNVIDYIRKRFTQGERVMLVAHGTFMHSLTTAATGLPLVEGFNFCSENTALTKVRYFENGRIRLSFSDDLSHLIPEFPHHTFSL
ncbi:MAG: histidine phosphatase family protein [Oscillospiraceae bacterium]|jgi:broad specificity phosphatase PhoE|nr:histidine phosphatase family protein [Oscillospiraceae bacterium]